MNKNNVLINLKKLSARLDGKVIKQKDVRTIPALEYYISLHFSKLGNALKAAGLKSSELAEKMSVTNEELLEYLKQLSKKLSKQPTTMDITRDGKFSYRIFKTRFGSLAEALNKIEAKKFGNYLFLEYELKRCIDLYTSGILHAPNSIFTQSVFIEILVRLNDILQSLNATGKRISFTDDVSGEGVNDITDLVNKLRNAACHDRTSGESMIKGNTFIFNRIVGRMPNAIKVGKDIVIGSNYNDDIAYFYGDKKIYLERHIKRLLDEISKKLDKEEHYE